LNQKLKNGYDHNTFWGEDKVMKDGGASDRTEKWRIMEVRTTQPAVQLYTGII